MCHNSFVYCIVYRIAYSVYEMQRIKESLLPNIKLVVMYDIACILDKHIKVIVLFKSKVVIKLYVHV